jgi:hypothetical protein
MDNYRCTRNFSIRNGTIFDFNPRIPITVLYHIINYWLIDALKVKKIKAKLEEQYNITNIDSRFIYKFISSCRKIIANYFRNVYSLERLANKNANLTICLDVSLFTHIQGSQTWVVGLINTSNNEIMLEVVYNRNEATIKIIIKKHICEGNTVCTDSWLAYQFLSRPDSGYIHNPVNHSFGIFGLTRKSKEYGLR